ncbi:nitrogen permease regulator 2-domain-containing protein [Lipomyces oligophaga]|uniref:nitrogen permease regulator 2-domain-containing protein n=1 Tax=Lipomyces oligophaga TaxID=45792 RepID=UPI0034CF499E
MTEFGGFPQLKALFYATFHPTEGTKVVHQVPPGSVGRSDDDSASSHPLFEFEAIAKYVVPRTELSNNVTTICVNNSRVVSYPVHITGQSYARNQFLFNFCFVFARGADVSSYLPVVKKLGTMFEALEEQGQILSSAEGEGRVRVIIDQVYEDLNNYCECFIPIDESNSVNIKLFPLHRAPPAIQAYDVPLSTVRLQTVMDVNWDPTMEKIVEYIDGINSVRRIASLADTDYELTRRCIQHLIYYNCVILIESFRFSNVYAAMPEITLFVSEEGMADECRNYVASRSPNGAGDHKVSDLKSTCDLLSLYCSLHRGQTVKDWYIEHTEELRGVDIRRFISFGVIKGLIYRIYDYPVLIDAKSLGRKIRERGRRRRRAEREGVHASDMEEADADADAEGYRDEEEVHDKNSIDIKEEDELMRDKLARVIASRRPKHLDKICLKMEMTGEQVIGEISKYGEVSIVRA